MIVETTCVWTSVHCDKVVKSKDSRVGDFHILDVYSSNVLITRIGPAIESNIKRPDEKSWRVFSRSTLKVKTSLINDTVHNNNLAVQQVVNQRCWKEQLCV